MKRYFQSIIFPKILVQVFEKLDICIKILGPLIINSRLVICISDERTWHPLQENEAIFSKNIYFNFQWNFRKITLAYYFCVIGGRRIFYISGERD